MAMLAEPRRKQKVINLRAKNNAWSNDNTKFGQRMLEKMGWTSGKGLGANENGITEHVVARYKNDEKGLGFEDKNDQWTKHEDDFNALLANLSNASNNTENLHSGISLEDKSKKSKARIHYHKFTRGKDISRYSEKDLANIFGKKSFKKTEEAHILLKEDLKTTEQIFTEKGSMTDYFKNKLAELKSKSILNVSTVNENDSEYDEPSYGFCGFLQETNNIESCERLGYNQENKNNNEAANIKLDVCDSQNLKKKKKKSKTLDIVNMCENINENLDNIHEQECLDQNQECVEKKIKKKRLKNIIQHVGNDGEIHQIQECIEEKIKKKKLKNKLKKVDNVVEKKSLVYSSDYEISTQSISDTDQILKTKKKFNKHIIHDSSQNTHICNLNELDQADLSQNKKKNANNKQLCEENFVLDDIIKKKKSKRNNYQNVEDDTQNNINIEHSPKKKKKKKSREN